MTLEEAKREIDRKTEEKWEAYEKSCCSTTLGEAYGLEEAMRILDQVDGVPVGNPDTLTLTELAHELRKIFKFSYLTVDDSRCICAWRGEKPRYQEQGGYWTGTSWEVSIVLETWAREVYINLSEYKDETGEIDYSKCIVEVE